MPTLQPVIEEKPQSSMIHRFKWHSKKKQIAMLTPEYRKTRLGINILLVTTGVVILILTIFTKIMFGLALAIISFCMPLLRHLRYLYGNNMDIELHSIWMCYASNTTMDPFADKIRRYSYTPNVWFNGDLFIVSQADGEKDEVFIDGMDPKDRTKLESFLKDKVNVVSG
jgi:hypothetical protein